VHGPGNVRYGFRRRVGGERLLRGRRTGRHSGRLDPPAGQCAERVLPDRQHCDGRQAGAVPQKRLAVEAEHLFIHFSASSAEAQCPLPPLLLH